MGRVEEHGTSTIEMFFYWIEERTEIWRKKRRGLPRPWTDDQILHEYKFTNAFRQLDRGTQHWLKIKQDEEMLFNLITYRMYNLVSTQERLGWITDWPSMREKWLNLTPPVFTGAHMTVGREGEDKKLTNAKTWDRIWEERHVLEEYLNECETMEDAFATLLIQKYFGLGKFIAYEIICDLRFTEIGKHWSDTKTWANIGPGCKRGLQRLGLPVEVESLRKLYRMSPDYLSPSVFRVAPFELREIEHSLCEFDKYERTRRGEGRPRSRYRVS